ncbi:MAG: peroxide stress protein YaaA [Gammaproteobacteria bacterium]|nr:peroxide stress protein YaaA [Gammaproteobacteria bacterium]MCW8992752.1 peroxide stress protein YaaA [Gammaproteobacteria bacterium]
MLLVISPAKTLDYDTPPKTKTFTIPDYLDDSQILIDRARQYSALDIAELMAVSMKIAELNFERFEQWRTPFTPENAKQAALAFKGDVYTGLDAESFSAADFKFAQSHLRILSGLYGLLRPLDLMQPYRLEMGRKVDTGRGKNLYEFWGDKITEGLNRQMKNIKSPYLINLASSEYFKSVKPKRLDGEIITPEFKDWKNGQYKMMGVYAKKARGQLSRFVIQNRLTEPEAMKDFDVDGYVFNEELSSDSKWVFTRRQ